MVDRTFLLDLLWHQATITKVEEKIHWSKEECKFTNFYVYDTWFVTKITYFGDDVKG